MTVIPFQPKPHPNSTEPHTEDKLYSPEEALSYVLQGIIDKDTVPEGMVIVWNDNPDGNKDVYRLRYMAGGNIDLASMVGMLELAKNDLMDE